MPLNQRRREVQASLYMLRVRQKLIEEFGCAVYIRPSAEVDRVNVGRPLHRQNASDIQSILGSLPGNGPAELRDNYVLNGGNKSRPVEKFDMHPPVKSHQVVNILGKLEEFDEKAGFSMG